MPIIVTCPSCSTTLKAPDAAAGKKVKCPKCTSAIAVPAAEAPPVMEEETFAEEPPARPSGAGAVRRKEAAAADLEGPPPDWQSNRVTCGILAIFLGAFGVHKFILGIQQPAVIMLVVTLVGIFCTAGLGGLAMWVIGLIEGIKYLQMSDADFYREYVVGKKPWF